MVDLPDPAIWNKAKYTTEFYELLTVRIRQCGYLFNRDSDWKTLRCVLTPKGYFIIYEKDKDLKGYAVNLHTATKLSMKSRSKFDEPQSGSSLKKENCLVTLKWPFGTVSVDLTQQQVSRWRRAILDAYEGANLTYSEKAQDKCVEPTACILIDLHCRVVVEPEHKDEYKEPTTSSSGPASSTAISDSSVPSASSVSQSHSSLRSNRDAPTSDYLADVSSTLDRLNAFERRRELSQLTLADTGFTSSDDSPSDVSAVPKEPGKGYSSH
ncbi:hypothetical protein AAVH_07439 [Aphelenchoides avenae]|nr:hypothetical protein AAVH_07439 [Aphelenchus avenae]